MTFIAQMAPFENRCMALKTEKADVSLSERIAGVGPFSCLKNKYLNAYSLAVPFPHDIGLNVWSVRLYRFSLLSASFLYLITWKTICQQHSNLLMKEPTFQNVSDHCMETHAAGPQYSEKWHRCTTSCWSLPWLPVGKHPTIFFISTLPGKSRWGAKYLIKGEM